MMCPYAFIDFKWTSLMGDADNVTGSASVWAGGTWELNSYFLLSFAVNCSTKMKPIFKK